MFKVGFQESKFRFLENGPLCGISRPCIRINVAFLECIFSLVKTWAPSRSVQIWNFWAM